MTAPRRDQRGNFARWLDLILVADVADAAHEFDEYPDVRFRLIVKISGVRFRPGRNNERLIVIGQITPQIFGHEGHEGVEQANAGVERVDKDATGIGLGGVIAPFVGIKLIDLLLVALGMA